MSTMMDNKRICGTCGKEFYIGMSIDSYTFKINQSKSKGKPPIYYCKYSCYKPAAELKVDGRGRTQPAGRR